MKKTILFLEHSLEILISMNTDGKFDDDIKDMTKTLKYLKANPNGIATPCAMRYHEIYCNKCEYKSTQSSITPAYDGNAVIERHYCDHGFWSEDF